jgi:hypothetical protein
LSSINERPSAYPRWGSGEIETHEVDMLDAAAQKSFVFKTGEPFVVRIRYRVREAVRRPVFGLGIYRSDGTYINGSNHHWRETPIQAEDMQPGEEGELTMSFEKMPLLQGQYYLTTFVYDHGKASPTAIDHREHVVTFEVIDVHRHQHGTLFLPSRWSLARRASGAEAPRIEESNS